MGHANPARIANGKRFMSCNNNALEQSPPLFYQQFLLGPEFANHLQDWRKTVIGNNLKLATHPDLNVTQASCPDNSLTLMGSILDPSDSEATNAEILNRLLELFSDFNALIEATYGYGGRWIVIAVQGEQSILFHDALGLRQAFYTDIDRVNGLWAMSQPGIVADQFELKISTDAREYIDSEEFRSNPEYRWPCAGTPFIEIKQLLPNHYLDLISGDSHRYWPCRSLETIPFTEALEALSGLLPGLVKAAAKRFDMVLGITAGLDSRLVLAACKDFSGVISSVSVKQNTMKDDHQDIVVPARLLGKFGLEHKVITLKPGMTPEFARIFRQNVFMAHEHYGPDAEAILTYNSHQNTALTGSGAEVGKCCYSEDFRNSNLTELTAETLLRSVNMGNHEFTIKHFNDWLNNLGNIYNVNVADLFQWEHAHGNWLAMTQLEFGLAWKEIITPFNCRDVLTTMLSVSEQYRKPPHYELFLELVKRLWPELLCEPINPAARPNLLVRLKRRLKTLNIGRFTVSN
jgi:hypothetical protein